MKLIQKITIVFLLISISYFSLHPFPFTLFPSAHAQSYDELADQLKKKQEEIKQVETQLAQSQAQEKTLNSQLNFIDAQNKLTQLKIEETEFQLKKLDKEINDLSG